MSRHDCDNKFAEMIGQLLTPAMNPVIEESDFMGNCTRPSGGSSAINVRVNGIYGLVIMDLATQTLTFTSFTIPNVTRRDNGAVFTCVVATSVVIASLTLEVLCE